MKRALLPLCIFSLVGCTKIEVKQTEQVSSFSVDVKGIYVAGSNPRIPLSVVTNCERTYDGGEPSVPDSVRGKSKDCRYVIPHGDVDIDLHVEAFNTKGERAPFDGVITFRAVPGDLSTDYTYRFAEVKQGVLDTTIRASHMYGEVRIWAEDAPPEYVYDAGTQVPYSVSDPTRARTYATGVSDLLYFDNPSLAKVQQPDGFDNRSSPFVGQFMVIGKPPESGEVLTQSCADLGPDGKPQPQDGQPATMVVTGMDPGGFYVTDLTACRVREVVKDPVSGKTIAFTPEPDGYLPGTFGAMYVYNYSFPDGLDQGDLIWTVSGSTQEFTSTTQLTFPAWTIREKVRQLPPDQWNKYLNLIKPTEINDRLCGAQNNATPYITDTLCGMSSSNMKLESLESSLVHLTRVRFPEVFTNCDLNGDGTVPFFCNGKNPDGTTYWRDCDFTNNPPPDPEMTCNIDCTIGQGQFANQRCSERSTYVNFGQYVVTMTGPGPAAGLLDDSLPAKFQTLTLSNTSQAVGFGGGIPVAIRCDADARYKAGPAGVTATETDIPLAAGQIVYTTLGPNDAQVAILGIGTVPQGASCSVGWDPQTKINLLTRDAVPDLNPDCDVNNADPALALQCKQTLAATYNVTGHLKQVQPGRPRWIVIPRDADDVCCYPGQGLDCPKPLKKCQ